MDPYLTIEFTYDFHGVYDRIKASKALDNSMALLSAQGHRQKQYNRI